MDINWLAFPLDKMRKQGYFPDFTGSFAELKEYAAENISHFLSPVDGFKLKPALLRTTAHLRTSDKETDRYALWAWQAKVLHQAQLESLPASYQAGIVTEDWMRQLAKLPWLDNGPNLAVEYLNKSGIHLVFESHLPRTYLDGAVCISADGNPIIALTLRHDRLDNFWFTLFHELAHINLHIDGSPFWYLDDLDANANGSDEIEQQAVSLAKECLIPIGVWLGGHGSRLANTLYFLAYLATRYEVSFHE